MKRRTVVFSLLYGVLGLHGQDLPPAPERLRGFLLKLADEQLARRREDVAALKTPQDIAQRQEYVRSTILKLMGGLPEPGGPLNLRRTGTLDRGDYRVEKVVFESLPGFYVTGSLYIPKSGTPPYPAVLQPVGHSQNGKAAGSYQSLSVGLVKNGFVVLTYDPIGQGERTIFYNADLRGSLVGSSTREHQMVGIQSLLAGQSVARYRVWDGIRGLDVLESLAQVDKARIGVAGCSGGGTLTTYLLALDKRIKAAAPACYISAWEEQLKGTGPQDAEQQFPDQLLAGINHGDYLIAFAPQPLLICSTSEDFFPIEGSTRTLMEMRRIYDLLGSANQVDRFVGPGGHGMRRETREAIVGWLNNKPGAPAAPLKLDPVKVAPANYRVEIDEPQARVIRAHIGGKQQVPMHEHGPNRVVVFLTDAHLRVFDSAGEASELKAEAGRLSKPKSGLPSTASSISSAISLYFSPSKARLSSLFSPSTASARLFLRHHSSLMPSTSRNPPARGSIFVPQVKET
jgi:dienelactone hydrolase